jgi:PBP1b-binding outer membrane lipoprotein LpoB
MIRKLVVIAAAVLLAGCTTLPPVNNTPSQPSVYISPGTAGPVQGLGIEGQDIESMCDRMVRDILSAGVCRNRDRPPRIVMDSAFFTNQSTDRIDIDLITDRMRVQLQRAAAGQMMFLARSFEKAVVEERERKESGSEDIGTNATTQIAGADYRLVGRISSHDAVQSSNGMQQRYTQITFELVDLQTEAIVWSNLYTLNKATQDDVIYR